MATGKSSNVNSSKKAEAIEHMKGKKKHVTSKQKRGVLKKKAEKNCSDSEFGKPTYEELVQKLKNQGANYNNLIRTISSMYIGCRECKALIDRNAFGKALLHFVELYKRMESKMKTASEFAFWL